MCDDTNTIVFTINVMPTNGTGRPGRPQEYTFVFFREEDADILDAESVFISLQTNLNSSVGSIGLRGKQDLEQSIARSVLRCSALVQRDLDCGGFVYAKNGLCLE